MAREEATGEEWARYVEEWMKIITAEGMSLEPDQVDAVGRTAEDFERSGVRMTAWWPRERLSTHAIVNWDRGLSALFTGDRTMGGRTSRLFPAPTVGAQRIAMILGSGPSAEVAIAVLTYATAIQQYRCTADVARLAYKAEAVAKEAGIHLDGISNGNALPQVAEELTIRGADAARAWYIDAHASLLRSWSLVRFRCWVLERTGYRRIDADEVAEVRERRQQRLWDMMSDSRQGIRPKRPDARAEKHDDERTLADAIREYWTHNGIRPLPVEFGVGHPTQNGATACTVGKDSASIVRLVVPGEPIPRGQRYARGHTTTVALSPDPDKRLSQMRAMVHQSLAPMARFVNRILALRRWYESNPLPAPGKDGGERIPSEMNPLWSLDVHAAVKAIHPDLTALFDIDGEDVPDSLDVRDQGRAADAEEDAFFDRGGGHASLEGTRIVPGWMELAPGLSATTTRNVTKFILEADIPETAVAAMKGRPLVEVVSHPSLPRDMTILSATKDGKEVEMRLEDRYVPAADMPEGVADWRLTGTMPEEWGAERKAVRPKQDKTPLIHEMSKAKWAKRQGEPAQA